MPVPISIPALLSYCLFIGSAYAQVSAPNCTGSTFAWVGSSFLSDIRFASITIGFSHGAGAFIIVVQFTSTKSLLGHSVPGGSVQQWRIRHPCFATPKSLHQTEWGRQRRSMQMQHGRVKPHQCMRRVPGRVVDSPVTLRGRPTAPPMQIPEPSPSRSQLARGYSGGHTSTRLDNWNTSAARLVGGVIPPTLLPKEHQILRPFGSYDVPE
ncbi:hypothetical protein EDB92DRAFT_197757 [Lactarius akahatsu]|uniref:Uncharacterized protein n=1 Tax=Lactarius akahatsu TaxID=416441 RepID=A0AAD4LLG4_9AGAM|nr:hypothetical protein EDB92DRAFT_197757 [Lactarius akahatsu]